MDSTRMCDVGISKSKQCILVFLVMTSSVLFLAKWEDTPLPNIFRYDNQLMSMLGLNAGSHKQSRPPSSLDSLKQSTLPSSVGCDYTEGKWVRNEGSPQYSGSECKSWLSKMWACRLFNRTDFSYENYQWQPNHCYFPLFNRELFLRRMQNRVIAFVGDSLGRQQFQSLMCMVSGGKDDVYEVEDASARFGLTKPPGAIRPAGWSYRFVKANTTILFYWSSTLSHIEPLNSTDPDVDSALHLDLPCLFLRQYLPHFDVLILNTGHHWNKGKFQANKWKMYAHGKPLAPNDIKLDSLEKAYNLTLHSIIRWVDMNADYDHKQSIFLRTISPRHFSNGDWDSGGRCENTHLENGGRERREERGGESPLLDGALERAVVMGTRVKLLNITLISKYRDEAHISKYGPGRNSGFQDCLHWCLPGVPDTWNQILFYELFQEVA